MRDREAEVLRELVARLLFDSADLLSAEEPGWARPLDIGGSDNSHHSQTLRRMIPKGWVEAKARDVDGLKPAMLYRVTEKGVSALQNHDASKQLAKAAEAAAKAKLRERLGRGS